MRAEGNQQELNQRQPLQYNESRRKSARTKDNHCNTMRAEGNQQELNQRQPLQYNESRRKSARAENNNRNKNGAFMNIKVIREMEKAITNTVIVLNPHLVDHVGCWATISFTANLGSRLMTPHHFFLSRQGPLP